MSLGEQPQTPATMAQRVSMRATARPLVVVIFAAIFLFLLYSYNAATKGPWMSTFIVSSNNGLHDWRLSPSSRPTSMPEPGDGPIKVFVVYGTRPEAVKMAPLVHELLGRKNEFDTTVCVTGQHREMLDQINNYFGIEPDMDLDVMTHDQTLSGLTSTMVTKLSAIFAESKPHVVVVQGDTTTAFVAALAAFYHNIAVAHVEAGLRTYNMYNPFPEEANRQLIGRLANFHFAATVAAKQALLLEHVDPANVYLTGNPVIDAAKWAGNKAPSARTSALLANVGMTGPGASSKRFLLVTSHRRENLGDPLKSICGSVLDIVKRNSDTVAIFPVHRNPNVRAVVFPMLGNNTQIKLIDPVDYEDMVHLMKNSYLIMTDSGGVQEEATTFGKPVLVLRLTTEREEGVRAGAARLVGVDRGDIVNAVQEVLDNHRTYSRMSSPRTVYGDGHASKRIADAIAGLPVTQFDAKY